MCVCVCVLVSRSRLGYLEVDFRGHVKMSGAEWSILGTFEFEVFAGLFKSVSTDVESNIISTQNDAIMR